MSCPSSLLPMRWRQPIGEERLPTLIQESLAVATRTGAAKGRFFQGDCRHHRAAEGGGLRPTPSSCIEPASDW